MERKNNNEDAMLKINEKRIIKTENDTSKQKKQHKWNYTWFSNWVCCEVQKYNRRELNVKITSTASRQSFISNPSKR